MDKDVVPQEEETIAAKRSERFAEKVKSANDILSARRAWWANYTFEVLGLILIELVYLYLLFPFFTTSAPFTTFSGPIIPFLAKILEFFGLGLNRSIQIVYLLFVLFFPLSYYFFIRKISGRKAVAFLSILIVSLPIKFMSKGFLESAFFGADGPHVVTLTIIPLALFSLIYFERDGGVKNLIISVLMSGLLVLISPFGYAAYLIFAGITTFSEILLGRGRQKVVRLLTVIILTAGVTAFWYHPSFLVWLITGPMGKELREVIGKLIPISLFTIPVLATFGYLLFDRKPDLQALFLASFFTIVFGAIAWAGGGISGILPNRFLPEFGMSLAFLVSIIILKVVWYLGEVNKYIPNITLFSLAAILLIIVIAQGRAIENETEEVLGIWTGINKGEVWEAKERFSMGSIILGYVVSAVSLSSMAGLSLKVAREK